MNVNKQTQAKAICIICNLDSAKLIWTYLEKCELWNVYRDMIFYAEFRTLSIRRMCLDDERKLVYL